MANKYECLDAKPRSSPTPAPSFRGGVLLSAPTRRLVLLLALGLLEEFLDEVLLVLARSVDRRDVVGLLGLAAAGSQGDAAKHRAKNSHGEDVGGDLAAGNLVVLDHVCEDGRGERRWGLVGGRPISSKIPPISGNNRRF